MLQEFFKTSIYCKTIKYILSQTALPLYKTITSDEFIIKDCVYIYKDKILKCTKSGMFLGLNHSNFTEDHLYVNDFITVSDDPDYIQVRKRIPEGGNYKWVYEDAPLTITDDVVKQFYRPFAEYEILGDYEFGSFIPGISSYFISNTNYYDSETHKYLGEYLRCLRDIKGIDLMSLYNCFNYKFVDNINIVTDIEKNKKEIYLSETKQSISKVAIVPIKFNKKYTIAINCPFRVYFKSVLYKDYLMRDKDNETLLTDKLNETYTTESNMTYNYPVTYEIKMDNPEMLKYENYLYLAIQLPSETNSSITVLEGDYTNRADLYISDIEHIESIPDVQLSKIFKTTISLLDYDDNKQHPFSDRLIEYILENTIDSRELIDNNIAAVEDKVNYHPRFKGHWSNTLRYILYNKYMKQTKDTSLIKKDILGFIDSDIERAINRGYIRND